MTDINFAAAACELAIAIQAACEKAYPQAVVEPWNKLTYDEKMRLIRRAADVLSTMRFVTLAQRVKDPQ